MARLAKDSIPGDLQGSLGKEIVFKKYNDKIVVSKYPDMSGIKPSAKQVESRKRMKAATAYALSIFHNPQLRKKYEKKMKAGENGYHTAIKEWYKKNKVK